MNKGKGMKWVISFFILINAYVFMADFLVILGVSRFKAIHMPVILFPFFMYVAACLLINNKYWILGCAFSALQSITQIIASKFFEVSNMSYSLPNATVMAIAAGMACLLLSSFLFYKLLHVSNIVSEQYAYKWMLALNDKLKKKLANTKTINFLRKDAILVMLLCAPTVLGVAAFSIAKVFRPGLRMPLESAADRFFVDLFVFGYPIALIGLPLVLIALFIGAKFKWKEGLKSSTVKAALITLIIALVAAIYAVKVSLTFQSK